MWIYTRNVPRSMFNFCLEIQTVSKNQALSHFQDEKKSPYFKCSSPNRFRWLICPLQTTHSYQIRGGGSGGIECIKVTEQCLFHCNSQISNIFAYACKDQPDIRYEQILTTCYHMLPYMLLWIYPILLYNFNTITHVTAVFHKIVSILFSKNCSNMHNMLKYTYFNMLPHVTAVFL